MHGFLKLVKMSDPVLCKCCVCLCLFVDLSPLLGYTGKIVICFYRITIIHHQWDSSWRELLKHKCMFCAIWYCQIIHMFKGWFSVNLQHVFHQQLCMFFMWFCVVFKQHTNKHLFLNWQYCAAIKHLHRTLWIACIYCQVMIYDIIMTNKSLQHKDYCVGCNPYQHISVRNRPVNMLKTSTTFQKSNQ